MSVVVLLPYAAALRAQSSSYIMVSPAKVTLLIGESKTFRLVDQNGHMQHSVYWDISDSGAFQVDEGDELTVTAKQAGDFRISGRSADGSAEASVKVMQGDTMPVGTVKWSSGDIPGCKTTKIVPAVPSANGPDVFEQSECDDGYYSAAYTADGILMWRRKIGESGTKPVAEGKSTNSVARLNPSSTSICDSVPMGSDQQTIRDLLHQQNLAFSQGSAGHLWVVQESNIQCHLSFDDKLVLTKKSKVFVNE